MCSDFTLLHPAQQLNPFGFRPNVAGCVFCHVTPFWPQPANIYPDISPLKATESRLMSVHLEYQAHRGNWCSTTKEPMERDHLTLFLPDSNLSLLPASFSKYRLRTILFVVLTSGINWQAWMEVYDKFVSSVTFRRTLHLFIIVNLTCYFVQSKSTGRFESCTMS